MKHKIYIIAMAALSAILLCSCSNNSEVMASVNGKNITKAHFEECKKSMEIMKNLMTDKIKNSDLSESEKEKQTAEIIEKTEVDDEALLDELTENAYIDSEYDFISYDSAMKTVKEQWQTLKQYSGEDDEAGANYELMQEYISQLGLTEEEYFDMAAKGYITEVNKKKAREEYGKEHNISDEKALDEAFSEYIDKQLEKCLVVYYK